MVLWPTLSCCIHQWWFLVPVDCCLLILNCFTQWLLQREGILNPEGERLGPSYVTDSGGLSQHYCLEPGPTLKPLAMTERWAALEEKWALILPTQWVGSWGLRHPLLHHVQDHPTPDIQTYT